MLFHNSYFFIFFVAIFLVIFLFRTSSKNYSFKETKLHSFSGNIDHMSEPYRFLIRIFYIFNSIYLQFWNFVGKFSTAKSIFLQYCTSIGDISNAKSVLLSYIGNIFLKIIIHCTNIGVFLDPNPTGYQYFTDICRNIFYDCISVVISSQYWFVTWLISFIWISFHRWIKHFFLLWQMTLF